MSLALDYAQVYETQVRPRQAAARLRRAAARAIWCGLFALRPRMALRLWRERSQTGV